MPDLSNLVPFHTGQVENFYLLALGQVKMYYANTIIITSSHLALKTSVDPDQLASSEAN